jgi:hypothetical protein
VLLSSGVVQSLGEGVSQAAHHSGDIAKNAANAFTYVFYVAAGFIVLGQCMFGLIVERPLSDRANVSQHREMPIEA